MILSLHNFSTWSLTPITKLTMRFNIITTCLTLFLLHLQLTIHLQAYTPAETFTISCGATGISSDGERTWMGDTNSKLLSLQDGSISAEATTQSPSTNQVPFTAARLSRSQFNYSFPVSAGPKFVRLFFYPASYSSFPRSEASFTVQSNQFTLLNSFNASLNADAEKKDTIFREYVVNVDDSQKLTLSFTPSQPNSYAFINGIEVLSMPSDLYYTSDMEFKLVGSGNQYSVGTSSALETEYRIKVGGKEISERNDTGLFRNWAGDDEDYLATQNLKDNLSGISGYVNGKMNITVNPDYVAPKELYRTARGTGSNGTLNRMRNLTWEFSVDTGFTYMLRLHFCELDPNIDAGYRVFLIYIQSQVAEDHADVMLWTRSQRGLAAQRNYAVLIPKNDFQKKVNLSLQMHPSGISLYPNPFLNGVEIFKISDPGSNNLAGPNPDPVQNSQTNQNKKSSSGSKTTIIGTVTGTVLSVVLISVSL